MSERPQYKLQDIPVAEIIGLDQVIAPGWLTEKIKVNRVIEPILVADTGDDGYRPVSGHRRARAARDLGLETVPAMVFDADDLAAVEPVLRAALNECRSDNEHDNMLSCEQLASGGWTAEQISSSTGITLPTARYLIWLANSLPPWLREAWSMGGIKYSTLRTLMATPAILPLVKAEWDQNHRLTAKTINALLPPKPKEQMFEETWLSQAEHLLKHIPPGYSAEKLKAAMVKE